MKLDLISQVSHFIDQGQLRGDSVEIMRVDHKQQIHLLPVAYQPLRDFNRYLSAHAESADVVRPFRLQLANLAQITLGHRFGGRQVIVVAIKASGLQSIEWVVRAETARQFAVDQDVAAPSMHAKEGRLAPSRLNRNERTPTGRPAIFANDVRQLFNRRRLKQDRQRETAIKQFSHFREQADGDKGISAQIEEVIAQTNRPDIENLLPKFDELQIEGIPGHEGRRSLFRSRARRRGKGLAIHFSVWR